MPRKSAACCPPAVDPGLFRALADVRRLTLLARLAGADEPLTVGEAAECCGVHVSGASRHLALLRDAGYVRATRDGREIRYTLDAGTAVRTLRDLIRFLEGRPAACARR